MSYFVNLLSYLMLGGVFFLVSNLVVELLRNILHFPFRRVHQICLCILASVLFLILYVTLLAPVYDGYEPLVRLELIPFHSFSDQWVLGNGVKYFHMAANMLMFSPLSFMLAVCFKRMRKLADNIGFCFLFSFGIEFVQYFAGRTSDIDDLMLNTLGALLGYLIYRLCHHYFKDWPLWKAVKNDKNPT